MADPSWRIAAGATPARSSPGRNALVKEVGPHRWARVPAATSTWDRSGAP
ncbi:hypothetical protein ABZZ36_19545 [Actinacidiphila glaucinigra]